MSESGPQRRARVTHAGWWWLLFALALAMRCGGSPGTADVASGSGLRAIGRRGASPGAFSYPRGVDVAPDGTIAVTDKTGRVQLISAEGKYLTSWQMPEWKVGTPTGIVFDTTDPSTMTLIVADTHYSRIIRYSMGGRMLKMFGQYGEAPGQMIYPTDVALDPQGHLFITEYGQHDRVMEYTPDGEFIRQWGSFGTDPGQFQRPMAIVWDSTAGRLVVADTCNHRLQLFTPAGDLIAVWGEVGGGPGQLNYPYDVAIRPDGTAIAVEYGNNRLQAFSADGHSLWTFGGAGAEPGQFGTPWGIALTPAGAMVIADTYNHRLQVLPGDVATREQ